MPGVFADDENTDKFREECGLFGIYSQEEDVGLLSLWGLYALQHRGQEGAGIAISNGNTLKVYRGLGLVSDVFKNPPPLPDNAHIAIGHTRYSTTGSNALQNTQPLWGKCSSGQISLAHNGNLTNALKLRRELELKGSVFQSAIDSEVIINLIARSKAQDIREKITESISLLEGAYCLLIVTKNQLIGVRDPYGFRPLCLGKLGTGWVLASESCALSTVGAEFCRNVAPGEMIIIDQNGLSSYQVAQSKRLAKCVFEYVYFARADSILDAKSVYDARISMGKMLAEQSKLKADVVIAVPDSGTAAAIGFSRESGIAFAEGLVKNRYIGRTFIQPNQHQREAGVHLKLNVVKPVVEGKSVIMIDDSIVRGTTSGKIVRMLKKAGARQVHLCVSSPPVLSPCYYGVDTSMSGELLAANKSLAEIRDFIGADSLFYLSPAGLFKAIGGDAEKSLCAACFNCDYPTELTGAKGNLKSKYIFEH